MVDRKPTFGVIINTPEVILKTICSDAINDRVVVLFLWIMPSLLLSNLATIRIYDRKNHKPMYASNCPYARGR